MIRPPGTGSGKYGRSLVTGRFSLEHAAAIQEEVYGLATEAGNRPGHARLAIDALRTGQGAWWHKARRRWQRARGTVDIEDFNQVRAGLGRKNHLLRTRRHEHGDHDRGGRRGSTAGTAG